eukprot:TRINITY_DN4077_c0_g2_i3.p1 TRINITY_DN4077_c0_g2~~TRINITY_DN4077_c0_g2_i3.p1  ORF type:complete len:314 (+),score=106.68 TRINITY_DN4077_c0_g2_i3:104-943(+)
MHDGYPDCVQKTDPVSDEVALECRQPRVPGGVVRIACVGDSITAGAHASNASMAFPQQLGRLLAAQYGSKYAVTNLGASGATMLKSGDSPYWKRAQFTGLTQGVWDVVIIMLGTNDAKDASDHGPHNWPHNCSSADGAFAPKDCLFTEDYASMISLVRTLGPNGDAPDVWVMIPPPLMQPGVYGMNATVINNVYPRLVPFIAKENGIPRDHVIDIYTAMGGPAPWTPSSFPAGGCSLNTPAAADCPYFCDAQSCDQCHPNDNGYQHMAVAVQKALGLAA